MAATKKHLICTMIVIVALALIAGITLPLILLKKEAPAQNEPLNLQIENPESEAGIEITDTNVELSDASTPTHAETQSSNPAVTPPDNTTATTASDSSAVADNTASVEIVDGVEYVNNWAVGADLYATTITLRPGTIGIADKAFLGHAKLESIYIPDGVTTIGQSAFFGCRNLESVDIPSSVLSVGQYAFFGCDKLVEIENYVSYVDQWAIEVERYDEDGEEVKEVVLRPDTVGIADYAFTCSDMTYVEIPDTVCAIGAHAFDKCRELPYIDLPANLLYIGDYAFVSCHRVKQIVIPDSVTVIGDRAFWWCNDLENVFLGAGTATISHSVFYGCPNLVNIVIPQSLD